MFDLHEATEPKATSLNLAQESFRLSIFSVFKRAFDMTVAGVLLLPLIFIGCLLVVLNPFLNRGALFFCQYRMGRQCEPFMAYKFRSMVDVPTIERGPFDALEHHRITPLGRFLRKTRLDELPQVINVLRGEMSLIGPRPDYLRHACVYLDQVPGYRERHAVRPGISGYAQVSHGYVDGAEGIRNKVAADLHYIRNASIPFDLWIAWRTFMVVVLRQGL